MCAAEYVRSYAGPEYDLIYVDCYDAVGIPKPCQSMQFVSNVAELVSNQGAVVVNLLPKRGGVSEVYDNWRSILGHGWVLPGRRKSNLTLVIPKQEAVGIRRALWHVRRLDRVALPLDLERPLMSALRTERFRGSL